MSSHNPQTTLPLNPPEAPYIFDHAFDTRLGELNFSVHSVGMDMWVTTEPVSTIPAGSLLINDPDRSKVGRRQRVMIVENGLFPAIRQQAEHVPSALTSEVHKLEVSVYMATEACRAARALHLVDLDSVGAWREFVSNIADDLGDVQDGVKIEAKNFLAFGSDPYDSLHRLNGTSRMLVLNAAVDRLERRIDFLDYLLGVKFNRRALELYGLLDQVWHARTLTLRETESMLVQFQRPRTITARWAHKAAARLDICATMLDNVHVAPFGTNSFPHCIRDLNSAANALRDERYDSAREALDMVTRSLELLSLQLQLEQNLLMVSSYIHRDVQLNPEELGAFARSLDNAAVALRRDPPFDRGFETPIVTAIGTRLDSAVQICLKGEWDGSPLYEDLSEACAWFGRSAA